MNRAARRRLLWFLALALLVVAAAVILLLPAPGQGIATGPPPLTYVGVSSCEECHADETERWRESHHAVTMQEASEKTVLGDFADARFTYAGVSSRFFRQAGGYFVRTDGPGGRMGDYRVRYALGVFPVQQYLIEMPGGRYQALGIAWDARPRKQGGQRWFQPYPDERVDHRSDLHWTKAAQNWNSRCAECHSTNVQKGYRWPQDEFATKFSAASVSCEACHGPGSRHVVWGRSARSRGRQATGDPGLVVRFGERRSRSWQMDVVRGIAKPTKFQEARVEVETCARCHARRELLTEEYWPGHALSDTHRPALLDRALYYADGQMQGEAYEWGSFRQSRMYAAGVTCADCHDAHDQKLKVGRDEVCSSCHQPEKFATRKHHFHREGGKGASCVACHMRSRSSMVVAERHDHSLRVPRPDLTVALGAENAPNACSDCHRGRSARWAASAVRRWYPKGRGGTPHYGEALALGRGYGAGAERALLAVFRDPKLPGIARATAVSLLPAHLTAASLPALQKAAADPDSLVRLAAASVLAALSPKDRLRVGVTLLWDPVRAVRIEAVPAFADVPDAGLASEQRAAFDRALDDYLLAQRANAEHPEAHVKIGIVFAKRGRWEEARRAYESALRIAPWFVPAHVSLADLLRLQGRDDEGEAQLRKALRDGGGSASLHQALGLLLARRGRRAEALAELRRAVELAPADPRLARDYALSLQSAGRLDEALAVLRSAQRLCPGARELLVPLVSLSRQQGAEREAAAWARRLLETNPDDPEARALSGALAASAEPPVR
jgi:tetratricopeptide (TPR) repeat protein